MANVFNKIMNFFKQSFKDMGESTKRQQEINKTNLEGSNN